MKAYLNNWDSPFVEGNKIFLKPTNFEKVECHFDFEGTPVTNPMFGTLYYDPKELKKIETPATDKQKEFLFYKGGFSKKQVQAMTFEDAAFEINELFNKKKRN